MIHLDTSVLVSALTGPRVALDALRSTIESGERVTLSTLVLYEWLRGPREPLEVRVQEDLCPSAMAVPFGAEEATISARLYAALPRPRGREIDLAIAACAIAQTAPLWTLNPGDFRDIPGLTLYRPSSR